MRKYPNFTDVHIAVQLVQQHLLKRLSFLYCIFLPSLLYINWPQVCGIISGFSIPLNYVFVFLPIQCSLITVALCSTVWDLKRLFVVVQSLSRVQLFATPWTVAQQDSLNYLPEFAQIHAIESVMPSNHLILCWPLLILPSIFASIRVFSNASALHIR